RSNGRVGVYSILSGERVGSTSFRSRLFYAVYVPEDKTIIALTADQSGSLLTETEVHAINIDMRAIEQQNYNSRLSITDLLPLELTRNRPFSYTLSGLNRSLDLNVQF
ncbi:MAG TPA: hypothetical protein VFM80_06625, partial [Gracilimonas sp.]|uniref:hypothetical protein n=1 Tax=Gracilimonas sp. TaxID=1974203 RepID=UPI002DA2D18E|nr:hypothetical protein [Gracilimonas sp.]